MVEEIKASFNESSGRELGSDGYSTKFFKTARPIVGSDIVVALQKFFQTSLDLFEEVDNSIITLVPKFTNALRLSDFRFISSCNVIEKAISKVLPS